MSLDLSQHKASLVVVRTRYYGVNTGYTATMSGALVVLLQVTAQTFPDNYEERSCMHALACITSAVQKPSMLQCKARVHAQGITQSVLSVCLSSSRKSPDLEF